MGICVFQAIFLIGILFWLIRAEPIEDKQALLDFANSVNHLRPLNWEENTSVCDYWVGIACNHDHSSVTALQLPGFGFRGPIPVNTLSRLSGLQILSLRSNGFNGPLPSDFSNLRNLNVLYLQSNKFGGSLPSDFSVWRNLSVINLAYNGFNGSIPSSISNLTHLVTLSLSNNLLTGQVPDLKSPSLQLLDLSYNNLTGDVPIWLNRFPFSVFAGNNLSFSSSPPLPPVSAPNLYAPKHSSKLGEPGILGIIIGCSTLVFVIVSILIVIYFSKKRGESNLINPGKKSTSSKKEKNPVSVSGSVDGGDHSLVFFEWGCKLAFDLEDLLRASAEVLGKGTFGTSYKGTLEDGTTVAVKRLKEVTVSKREFELQMQAVGNLQHENVAPLRAYYFSKDERLMVYDYYVQGSVSAMLHGKSGENRIYLDWETRLRIAIGAARGIAHIHTESGGKLLVHGNIKATNIFLNSQNYGCVSDLGLATLITQLSSPPLIRTVGYRAPELSDNRKASQASDVYSYGVVLLELLTGKSPIHSTGRDEVVHLVRWVQSVVREEWTAEVFDVGLLRYPNIEEEMVEMLRIGMACVARTPEQRPKMVDVLKMVEDVRRDNTGNGPPSTGTMTEDSTPNRTPLVIELGSSSNTY